MSQRQRTLGSIDIADRLSRSTVPGKRNVDIINSITESADVVGEAIRELNNWVEVVDVRIYRGKKIGIPCRYRWTIRRWAENSMDAWMMENGWMKNNHLMGDSRDHEANESEHRFSKEFGGWTVYVNIWVEWTDDVFDELNGRGGIDRAVDRAESKREKRNKVDRIRRRMRN